MMDIPSFSTIAYIFSGLFNVLEKNDTCFPFLLSVAEMARFLVSVSTTKLWSTSTDNNVTSLNFCSVSKALLALVDGGNTSVTIKNLISVEKSAIHIA